jgi:hypothetical protein
MKGAAQDLRCAVSLYLSKPRDSASAQAYREPVARQQLDDAAAAFARGAEAGGLAQSSITSEIRWFSYCFCICQLWAVES